jgi:hypothetical protein
MPKLTLRPSRLVPRKLHTSRLKCLPNQVSALGWDMSIHFTKNHDKFSLDVFGACERVVFFAFA